MKKYIKIIICILCLVILLFAINYLNTSKKPKFVDYDMDAKDSIHYELGDTIKIDKVNFTILDYESVDSSEEIKILLNLKIDKNNYQLLQDKYTFGFAYNNKFLLQTNCSYDNDKIYVVDFSHDSSRKYNQVVVIDNQSLKIVATIELNNE